MSKDEVQNLVISEIKKRLKSENPKDCSDVNADTEIYYDINFDSLDLVCMIVAVGQKIGQQGHVFHGLYDTELLDTKRHAKVRDIANYLWCNR